MPPKKTPVQASPEATPEPTPQPSPILSHQELPEVPSASRSYARSAKPKGKSRAIKQDKPNLAEAITLMTAELKSRDSKKPSIKAKEPDTFDGSDPKKLNNFILLCSLYFRH